MLKVITVIGLGFVGLTTALCFAELGKKVYGVELDENKKRLLKNAELYFCEPKLDEILKKELNNNFILTDDLENAVKSSEIIFFCVGTPCSNEGNADLTDLLKSVDSVLKVNNDGKFRVLVIKSTVPPSWNQNQIIPLINKNDFVIGKNIGFAFNPEFLREGHCYDDFMNADRIVVGTLDNNSKEIVNNLYKIMNIPLCNTNINTAEFVKYLSNSLLATLISYSNEMSIIANKIGEINIKDAFNILKLDKRFDNYGLATYVYPGCGYGGYCLPKDTKALYNLSKELGYEPNILKNVILLNEEMCNIVVKSLQNNMTKKEYLGVLGLSFKPGSNDIRESVSLKVIKKMLEEGYKNIIVYDPISNDDVKNNYPDLNVKFASTINELLDDANLITILTGWEEFKGINKKTNKKIIDFRYIL